MSRHYFWGGRAREPVDKLEARVLSVADRLERAAHELECLVSAVTRPSEETRYDQPERRR